MRGERQDTSPDVPELDETPEPGTLRAMLLRVSGLLRRVIRRFRMSHGPMLASAIAFDALLSVVPLLALALLLGSYLIEASSVKTLIESQLAALPRKGTDVLLAAYTTLIEQREEAGILVLGSLLVFGTMAFRTIREALTVVFEGTQATPQKGWRAALMPVFFVALIGSGIFLGTLVMIVLDAVPPEGVTVFGVHLVFRSALAWIGRGVSLLALLLFFASLYHLLPRSRPAWSLCLIGGLGATALWEVARRIAVFYFAHVSMVGLVYGSLASVVVLLASLEVAAFALLLGGQLIAELGRSRAAGLPWYQAAEGSPP